ncbi:MAG: CCA tRNA nucleotidyltransferase [Pirellulales bacterium]
MNEFELGPHRDFAYEVVRRLRDVGHQALWAGGCVRDQLLGLLPKDYDVATSARPEQIRELFGQRRTIAVGAAFGVIAVLGPRSAGSVEVATFRGESQYLDGRHPSEVHFTDAEHDAQRRDFTINGLFFDPMKSEVIDYVNGQRDLAERIVRAIGDPTARFADDKLRMLRAVRFAATFNFTIEPTTLTAIERHAAEIHQVSAERIGMEVRRMLLDPRRAAALKQLEACNLLVEVLPEVARLPRDIQKATRAVLRHLDDPTLSVALAAALHRAGGPDVAREVSRRLRFTNKEADRTEWLLSHLEQVAAADRLAWPQLQRILVHEGGPELVQVLVAITGETAATRLCREKLAMPVEELNPAPLVDGSDLLAAGVPAGPGVGKLLEQIRDSQLAGSLTSREHALESVKQALATGP